MKKLFLLTLTLFALIMVISCDSLSPSERLLVGKWYYQSQTDEDADGTSIVTELYDTYKDDYICETHGTLRMTKKIEKGIYEIITLDIKYKGTWEINDKQLTVNITNVDITIKDVDFGGDNLTTDNSVIKEMANSERKRLYYDLVIPLKKESMGEVTEKILTLNDSQLVTKDMNGEKTEYSRMLSE